MEARGDDGVIESTSKSTKRCKETSWALCL